MNHPLSDMMTNSMMAKIRDMIDVNTVVGDPITTPGGVTIIPVTKVSIGYGAGGSDFAMKNMPANRDNPFGGGAGGRRSRSRPSRFWSSAAATSGCSPSRSPPPRRSTA